MGQTINRVQGYVDRVLSGELPSCNMVKLACKRWNEDWKRDDLFFDERAVSLIWRLASNLKHFKGELAGHYIKLEDWQLFIIANVFGWKMKATKKRRYTYADVFVPRKNGKTTFATVIALGLMLFDNEAGAEVYAAAVDREQAKICFEAAKNLLHGSIFEPMVEVYKGSIVAPDSASVFKPLSKDTKNKDGLNPHAAICDERHAWKTNEIYEVLKTGMGARSQPMIFSISTAGTDTSLPYFSDLQVMREILLGVKQKDNHFVMIYEPDKDDDWQSPETWEKVNPNLGVSLSRRYIEEEFEEAKMRGGTTLAAFMTKNLNMWVDAPDVWIQDDDVCACDQPFDLSQLAGTECYVGLDLASKTDLSAVALWFPKFRVARLLYIVPESKVTEAEDRVDYRLWREQGWLVVTPGKVLDEDWFVSWLLQALSPYRIKCIAYDPWGMWNIAPKLTRYSDALMEYQQSIRYMSVPTKEVESMVLKHSINLLGNPILRWNFGNVVVYRDPNGNIKLDKARSRNKIDGVVALVDAIGGWLTKTANDKQIYATHALRTVSM